MESILIVDNNNKIEFSNPTLHQLFEVDIDEDLTGRNFLEFVVKEHWDMVSEQTDTRKSGESSRYELKIITAKNNIKWASLSVCPRLDEEGNTIGAFATVVDITKMKTLQFELSESKERFRDIALCTADWLWETDKNARYTFCSEMVIDSLGYPASEILGKTPYDLAPLEDQKYLRNRYLEIFNNKENIVNLESRNIHKNGYMKIFLKNGIPILDKNGDLLGYRGVDKDITIQKLAEAEISRAQILTERKNDELKTALSNAKQLTQQARQANHATITLSARINLERTTAMNGLMEMTDILMGTELTPQQADYATRIKQNANKLLAIIKDADK
jgi:PAS domain S-box-containing protein